MMASSTHRLSELKRAAKALCCDAQQSGMRIKAGNAAAGGLAEVLFSISSKRNMYSIGGPSGMYLRLQPVMAAQCFLHCNHPC